MAIFREIKHLLSYNFRYTERLANHAHRNVYRKAFRDLELVGFRGLKNKDVLDLGCGQRFPFALQCSADGANVTALDIHYIKPDRLILYFFKCLKHSGLKRAAKSSIRRTLFDKKYYRALDFSAQRSISSFADNIQYVTEDPTNSNYSLPSETFDLIASNAVLEHVSDLSAFVAEIQRLLRPNGYFYGYIHNFFSISGGHNLEWAFPDDNPSKTIPPWDHLRANNFPTHVFLNQYTPNQFKNEFAQCLEILLFEARDINHDSGGKEGVRFLKGQVAEELHKYPRDLLLTRAYCIICRKIS